MVVLNVDAQALFGDIDPGLWERVTHNPVKFHRVSQENSTLRPQIRRI